VNLFFSLVFGFSSYVVVGFLLLSLFVLQAIVLSDENGHSKGCAFVYYQKPQDAARAIRELNSSTMYGRPIYVCEHTNKQNHQQNFVNRS